MWQAPQYLVVEAAALPEVFVRVAHAKSLLESGEVTNYSLAAKAVGISRSAFYKYKDSVFHYERSSANPVASYSMTLRDRPGVLSGVIGALYREGVNILTINQNIPVDGFAPVSISVSLPLAGQNDIELLAHIKKLDGVLEARIVGPLGR